MHYVYLIRSLQNPSKTYIGQTNNLDQRMEKHNSGASVYTSDYRPWKLVTYIAFSEQQKARDFEKYLKIGSGHTFAQRRLW
ncbi:MAG TPA: GIY-YIG nuclease family protein [Candidatus Babeliales bacterium]|nr:GIY-YIG nuclease family protein [Candidatus Babeliales bacterium]